MKYSTSRLLRVAPALLAVALLAAADWPRFRGPNGTGVSSDPNVPTQWSPDSNVLWKVEIPGKGNSSPIVCGEKLFLQTATEDGKKRLLLCLDANSGKTLWTYDVGGTVARTHAKNTLASSTPACDGERVYALFWDGAKLELVACDTDGKEVWKRDLGPYASQHGAGQSPVVYGGRVFLNNDQDKTSKVQAFDAKTGKTLWEVERPVFVAAYATPFMLEQEGGPALVVASTAGVTAYAPDSGKVLWNWEWDWGKSKKSLRMVSSPIVSKGLIFLTTGDGGGSRAMAAVQTGTDVSGDRLVWSRTRSTAYVPCLLANGDYLFAVNDKTGLAHCFVARTGEEVWEERLGGPLYSSPVMIDGKIYVTDESGTTFVYPALPEFELLAQNRLDEAVYATPAVSDGKLYIRGTKHLFCIGKK